jgi:PAS domain-containing protein
MMAKAPDNRTEAGKDILGALVDSSIDGFFILNSSLKVVRYNSSFGEIFKDHGDITRAALPDLLLPPSGRLLKDSISAAISNNRHETVEIEVKRSAGNYFYLVSLNPMRVELMNHLRFTDSQGI